MTKALTASASVTTPLSKRPSSPHEKDTAPDGKKLSPNWRTASVSATSLIPSPRRCDLPPPDAPGDRHSAQQVLVWRSRERQARTSPSSDDCRHNTLPRAPHLRRAA